MPDKWTRREFAQSIRAKHLGAYTDWTDDELVDAYIQKFPVYRDQVESPLDVEVKRLEESGISTRPSTPALTPPKPPVPPRPSAPSFRDTPREIVGKVGRDVLTGAEALIRGATLGGVDIGVGGDTGEEQLAEMGGAMAPGIAGTILGGPVVGASVMAAQGAGGSIGRSAREVAAERAAVREQTGVEQPPVTPADVFTPKNITKALGHAAAGYVTGRLPGAIGTSIPARTGTGVVIGGATAPLPQIAEDLIEKGSVDLLSPQILEQAKFGSELGLVPGVATALARGVKTLKPPSAAPLSDGWVTPKEPIDVGGDTVIAYQPVQGGWNVRLAGDPTKVVFKAKPRVRVGGEEPPPPPPPGGDVPPPAPGAVVPFPDDVVERIKAKLAAGEPLGSLDRRKDFAERQRVEAARAAAAAPGGDQGVGGGESPDALSALRKGGFLGDERGAVSPEVALQIAAPATGALLGYTAAGEEESTSAKASAALLGAIAGAGVAYGAKHSKIIPSGRARREIEHLKSMAIGKADEALAPMNPQIKKKIRQILPEVWSSIEAKFRPFHQMIEAGQSYGSANFFEPVVREFADYYTRQYQHPVSALRRITAAVAPVMKSYRDSRQAFQILRLQRDIGNYAIDNARKQEAIQALRDYTIAKQSGAGPSVLRVIRERQKKVRAFRRLSPTRPVRMGMTFQDAALTLNNLVADAQANRPQVLQAVSNVRALLDTLGQELVNEGILSPITIAENRHYFPDYVLEYLTKPTTAGGGTGIRPHKLGALEMRQPRDPDLAIWNDLGGPLMKRLLDQEVMLDNYRTVTRLVNQYHQTGPGGQIPKGYTTYHFKDRSSVAAPSVQGVIPVPLAAELSARFHQPDVVERLAQEVRRVGAGAMIRFAALPFLMRNWASDFSTLYAKTKLGNWLHLPREQLDGMASALLLEMYDDLQNVPPEWRAHFQLGKEAEQRGVGIAAAAAEVTEAAVSDPNLRSMARDPSAPASEKIFNAITDPVRGAAQGFDKLRAVQEASNRIAMFMDLTRQGTPPAQAGQLVNDALGNYSRSNFANFENRWLRQIGLMYFYAWQKIAGQNWIPFAAREVVSEGVRHQGRKRAALAIGKQYARIAIPFIALPIIWNHTMFPEVEASLTDRQKDIPHLIVPDVFNLWDEENQRWNVRLISLPGPINTVARMVGLGGAPNRAVHFAQGTGRQTIDDELAYSVDQAYEYWLGLLGATVSAPASFLTKRDIVTGIPYADANDPQWKQWVDSFTGAASSLPPARQIALASREGRTGAEDARAFLERLVTGGVYQAVDRDVAMDRAVRRAIAEGHRAGDQMLATRREERDELPIEFAAQLTEEEKRGFSKVARRDWQKKAVELLRLRDRAAGVKDVAPEDPGAVKGAVTVRPTREGLAPVPTTARLRALGPQATLKEFLTLLGNDDYASWRSQASQIANQLRREDASWESTSAIMMMLQQAPSGYADVEIDRRLEGLIRARGRQQGEGVSWPGWPF